MKHPWVFCRVIIATMAFIFLSSLSYGTGAAEQGEQSWWRGGSAEEGGDHDVKRSPSDNRAYRYLTLDNGLKMLLISDPETDKSAASLNVNVGSFQNPEGREGLAHFLEHMLFLGTDKYPEAGAYQKFISEHGGRHNAYTSMEDTNYFFDVDAKYLFAALKRFSRFFIAPRFDKAYVDRERNAVDSEFRLKLKDDNRREWEVFSEQVAAGHPLAMFSVGNLDTLADRDKQPVRADLIAFYRDYYAAERMTLVVLAREPLGQLEVVVRGLFAAVPGTTGSVVERPADESSANEKPVNKKTANKNFAAKQQNLTQPSFKTDLPFQLNIQPLKDQRSLSIAFPMPTVENHWRSKPDIYWGHVLGDESEGSLIAQLKKTGLANGLGAGLAFDTAYGASFVLQVKLTPEGVEQQALVLGQVFGWLNLARREGLSKWRFDELSKLLRTKFRFAEKYAPASYVQRLSTAMRHYPPQEVLRGPHLLSDFNEQVLSEFAKHLRPDNALITLLAPEVKGTDRVSSRYGAAYGIDSVDRPSIRRWADIRDQRLSLAPPNPYLAKAYPLSGKGGEGAYPLALDAPAGTTVWHYADQQFGTPRGLFDVRIATAALDTCRNVALAELYLAMVRDALGEKTYQASLAGLSYSLNRWNNGVGLSVNGYTDRQAVLLDSVLEALAKPHWEQGNFERLRSTLARNFRNSRKQWPIRQLFAQVGPLMKGSCDEETLADQLDSLSLKDLPVFHSGFYGKGHVRFYAGGALSAEQSLAMADATMTTLQVGRAGDQVLYEKIAALPEIVQRRSLQVDHSDSGVLLYIQGDEDSLGERARMAMINMALEAPFYTTMRTEKQLGYVVGAQIMHLKRVPGLAFFVQSNRSGSELEQEINDYLVAFEAVLEALSEEEVQGLKLALLANIQEKPQNIMAQAGRHLESLALGYEDFEFRNKLVVEIEGLDKEGLVRAYRRLIIDGSRRLWMTAGQVMETGSEQNSSDLISDAERAFAYPE